MKILFLTFLLFKLIIINGENCFSGSNISNVECFNRVIYFNMENKYYRAGHFALNSKGDMIIEYSYNKSRLFYGLKKDGKHYYPEITKEIEIKSNKINSTYFGRYESVNSFISLMDDINKENEYLLSISSYITILELHDLESNAYDITESVPFFNSNEGIYSYIFQILEKKIENKNVYFIIYITSTIRSIHLKKIGFENTSFESVNNINQTNIEFFDNFRITSSIIIDYYNIISIFIMYRNYYYALFFDYNTLEQRGGQVSVGQFSNGYSGLGFFFKAYYLYDRYIVFIYFENIRNFVLKILNLYDNFSITTQKTYSGNNINLSPYPTMNEFLKIDNYRFVLLSTNDDTYPDKLYIIFFDYYSEYSYQKVRYYYYNSFTERTSYFAKEISAFIYNDFLIFTGTILPKGDTEPNHYYPILLMFGYPNGTDFEIDISPYLMDIENYNESNNLYNLLMENMQIDNNIFGYEKVEQIKLVSIPKEIIFLNGTDNSSISNNDTFDANYILKQNVSIIKDYNYYTLDYQYIVKEPNYSTIYSSYLDQFYGDSNDLSENFTPKIFYGRTNTLKFKLCHNYCKTCKTMGVSNYTQKCESCKEEYSFFRLDSPIKECVPLGYYYDESNKKLIECTTENSKFYMNITSNKIICFNKNSGCPIDYNDYNKITGECKYPEIKPSTITIRTIETNKISTSDNIINSPISTNNNYLITSNIIKVQTTNKEMVEIATQSNEEINKKIDTELLKNYTVGDESLELKGENNTVFQLTTTSNEFNRFIGNLSNDNSLSIIDLGTCETTLKNYYKINLNTSLIIKKYEQITISAERNVQYEVYHPISKEKLNLSLCDSDKIDLYIPIKLDEKLIELYEDLQNSGYDLFNIDDPFYSDLCSPYKSQNGTDVLLSDRKNDYYNNNYTTCQSNCEYSSYNSKYQFLKCECKVVVDDIDINDFDKFSKKIYKNFYDILKNSNYKTLKCYKLVFNGKYLKKNVGSFIVLAFLAGYVSFFAIYIIKGITPLQEEAMKSLFIKFKNINIDDFDKVLIDKNININSNITNNVNINKNEKEKIIESPPKKRRTVMIESDLSLKKGKKKKRKSSKFAKTKTLNNNLNSVIGEKSSMNDKKEMVETKKGIIEDIGLNKIQPQSNIKSDNNNDIDISTNYSSEKLDDLDLNNLSYEKAMELDKRQLIYIYWNRLKMKHLIIYTFISCNDHNLIYIKISRFLFLICTSMAMNVIFFFDSSMHKIYIDYGKYNFIKQIPQIIYSSIVSLIIEILIGILSYTDKNIYEIRQLKEFSSEKINKIFKKIKIKLIVYFVVTFIFFLFYWYLISSFCAVYNNTQIIYLKDFITSFCLGLLYPFLIQLCFAFLRIFSLRKNNKFRSLLYKFC